MRFSKQTPAKILPIAVERHSIIPVMLSGRMVISSGVQRLPGTKIRRGSKSWDSMFAKWEYAKLW